MRLKLYKQWFCLYRTIKTIVVPLCFIILCSKQVEAQNLGHFDRITTENGLSQSDVNAILQDKDGFMWFGTHDGLNRHDGYSFKVFKPIPNEPNSISSNLIFDLEEDYNGNIWIGTTGRGLVFFDRISERFQTLKHDKVDLNSINSNSISIIYQDKENRLWVGTDRGLNMIDLKDYNKPFEFKRFKAPQEPYLTDRNIRAVISIYEDTNGQIWTGGFGGLYKLARESNGDMYMSCVNSEIGLPITAVSSISEFNGRLLFGTGEGLYLQSKNANTFKVDKVMEGSFSSILVDNNIIWSGTDSGLWEIEIMDADGNLKLLRKHIYDPKNSNSISKNRVISLFKDNTGIIWAGTNGGGVNKFDPNRKQFIHIRKTQNPNSLSYDKIRSFFEDSSDRLWVGTEGGGLNMLINNNNYNDFYKIKDLPNVFAIEEVKRKNGKFLLFGGQGNGAPPMFEMNISTLSDIKSKKIAPVTDFNHSIFSMLTDSRGYLWIGTYNGGLYRWILNDDGITYQKDIFINQSNDSKSLSGNIIRNIFEDSSGNIWLATNDGLSFLSKHEVDNKYPAFTVFKNSPGDKQSISHNYILSIHEDKNNTIWIGTFGGGLNAFKADTNGNFKFHKTFGIKDGLPNDVVKGIIEDDMGYLWLSTNKGLSKFNPKAEAFKNYDVNDGLQSNEFQELAYYKRKNGEFLFGGVNGFNAFFPQNLRENGYKPETVITKFLISNKEVKVGEKLGGKQTIDKTISEIKEVELKHFQNNISFEFAALHYASPMNNKFVYKLEGFDEEWQTTVSNKRYAAYTNLAPGDYMFQVKSSNNDGLWNDTPATIHLSISPPFWFTWWAYTLYGLIILGILWSIQSYLNLRSKQRASLQVQKEIEQVNKLKLQFFTNISHEFKTPITLILNPIEELMETVSNNLAVQSKLKVIQRNANSLLRLVHQLMEFRRIEVGETRLRATKSNIANFIKEITYSFQVSAEKKGINISFKSELNNLQAWFDWDKLEKILNNLIYNAIKFTPSGGNVEIRLRQSKANEEMLIMNRAVSASYLEIVVEDSGVGMDKAQLPYVFHRFYQVDQSNRAAHKGSGIGLAITKDLVDLHHGEIEVASEKGKGTAFTIKLPLGKSHLLEEEILEMKTQESTTQKWEDQTDPLNEATNEVLGQHKESNDKSVVLVVDDNADIRELIKEGLSKTYNILEAEHGKEALHIALKEIPDLIITDVLMPEMDGVQLCQEIKNNVRTSHIPVIMLTALNSVEHRIEGLESGADAYIPKPFKMKLLSVRVDKLISFRNLMRKRFQTEKELIPEKVSLDSAEEEFLKKIMGYMEANMGNELYWVDELASDMNTSRSTFFRKLKKLTGQSPNDFMRMVRLKRAAQLLEQNELTIAQISYMVGFTDPGYFGKCFRKVYGDSPSNYLKSKKVLSE